MVTFLGRCYAFGVNLRISFHYEERLNFLDMLQSPVSNISKQLNSEEPSVVTAFALKSC